MSQKYKFHDIKENQENKNPGPDTYSDVLIDTDI